MSRSDSHKLDLAGAVIADVESPGDVRVQLKVVPNASRDRVVGMLGQRVKVQVAAPPEDGKANKAVCQLLARLLKVSKSQVTVVAGATRSHKTLRITSVTSQAVRDRLEGCILRR